MRVPPAERTSDIGSGSRWLFKAFYELGLEARFRVNDARRAAGSLAGVHRQQFVDAHEHLLEQRRIRQQRGAEMIAVRNVEAGARCEQHVFLLEQVESE